MFEPNEVLQVLSGRGALSAVGIEPVKVRYKLVIERRNGSVLAHGSVTGRHAALHPLWLTPDATLQLKDTRLLAVSLTDLVGDTAEFESTEPVAPG
ncbi:Copper-binding protein [Methylorubrum thiocyanatum]